MEGHRRRSREYLKGKLMTFHRGNKASSTVQYSKPSFSSASAATVGYVAHQDYVIAQPKPKVAFAAQLEDIYGIAADESVDTKAAMYISRVQERWKLERLNSERMKLQES